MLASAVYLSLWFEVSYMCKLILLIMNKLTGYVNLVTSLYTELSHLIITDVINASFLVSQLAS